MDQQAILDAASSALTRAIEAAPLQGREQRITFASRAVPFLLDFPSAVRAKPSARAAGEEGEGEKAKRSSGEDYAIKGTASSTSVDWYGTEMSRACLEDMAGQFRSGVELFPGHGSWLKPMEWDESMGRTSDGYVEKGETTEQADPAEPGFMLTIEGMIRGTCEKADALYGRMERQDPTGLSIGGWFRDLRIMRNDEGEVERVIIERVELDHLAITRNPANPDCYGLQLLRSAAVAGSRAKPATLPAEQPSARSAPAPVTPESAAAEPAPKARSAEPSSTPSSSTETDMSLTIEQLRAVMGETLAPHIARLDALEAARSTSTPAAPAKADPAPANTDDRSAALQRELDALKAEQARTKADLENERAVNEAILRSPNRTGGIMLDLGSVNPDARAKALETMAERARDLCGGRSRFADTLLRNKNLLAGDFDLESGGLRGQERASALRAVPTTLTEICRAAEMDGLLVNPWAQA